LSPGSDVLATLVVTTTAMTELSPAAQAMLSAYHEEAIDYIEEWGSFRHKRGLAAALEAVADQVVPDAPDPAAIMGPVFVAEVKKQLKIRSALLAIAAELKAQ
jgi:hypothetical protein